MKLIVVGVFLLTLIQLSRGESDEEWCASKCSAKGCNEHVATKDASGKSHCQCTVCGQRISGSVEEARKDCEASCAKESCETEFDPKEGHCHCIKCKNKKGITNAQRCTNFCNSKKCKEGIATVDNGKTHCSCRHCGDDIETEIGPDKKEKCVSKCSETGCEADYNAEKDHCFCKACKTPSEDKWCTDFCKGKSCSEASMTKSEDGKSHCSCKKCEKVPHTDANWCSKFCTTKLCKGSKTKSAHGMTRCTCNSCGYNYTADYYRLQECKDYCATDNCEMDFDGSTGSCSCSKCSSRTSGVADGKWCSDFCTSKKCKSGKSRLLENGKMHCACKGCGENFSVDYVTRSDCDEKCSKDGCETEYSDDDGQCTCKNCKEPKKEITPTDTEWCEETCTSKNCQSGVASVLENGNLHCACAQCRAREGDKVWCSNFCTRKKCAKATNTMKNGVSHCACSECGATYTIDFYTREECDSYCLINNCDTVHNPTTGECKCSNCKRTGTGNKTHKWCTGFCSSKRCSAAKSSPLANGGVRCTCSKCHNGYTIDYYTKEECSAKCESKGCKSDYDSTTGQCACKECKKTGGGTAQWCSNYCKSKKCGTNQLLSENGKTTCSCGECGRDFTIDFSHEECEGYCATDGCETIFNAETGKCQCTNCKKTGEKSGNWCTNFCTKKKCKDSRSRVGPDGSSSCTCKDCGGEFTIDFYSRVECDNKCAEKNCKEVDYNEQSGQCSCNNCGATVAPTQPTEAPVPNTTDALVLDTTKAPEPESTAGPTEAPEPGTTAGPTEAPEPETTPIQTEAPEPETTPIQTEAPEPESTAGPTEAPEPGTTAGPTDVVPGGNNWCKARCNAKKCTSHTFALAPNGSKKCSCFECPTYEIDFTKEECDGYCATKNCETVFDESTGECACKNCKKTGNENKEWCSNFCADKKCKQASSTQLPNGGIRCSCKDCGGEITIDFISEKECDNKCVNRNCTAKYNAAANECECVNCIIIEPERVHPTLGPLPTLLPPISPECDNKCKLQNCTARHNADTNDCECFNCIIIEPERVHPTLGPLPTMLPPIKLTTPAVIPTVAPGEGTGEWCSKFCTSRKCKLSGTKKLGDKTRCTCQQCGKNYTIDFFNKKECDGFCATKNCDTLYNLKNGECKCGNCKVTGGNKDRKWCSAFCEEKKCRKSKTSINPDGSRRCQCTQCSHDWSIDFFTREECEKNCKNEGCADIDYKDNGQCECTKCVRVTDAPQKIRCHELFETCTSRLYSECCGTTVCTPQEDTTNLCEPCYENGDVCDKDTDCCSVSCNNGKCTAEF